MKVKINRFLAVAILAFMALSCTQKVKQETIRQESPLPSTGTFGKVITANDTYPALALPDMMDSADTISAKLKGAITACCAHSGCWMDMDMGENKVLKVTFLNDEFVIPKDATGKTAIIEGYAYKELIPVEILRHYAEEQGKTSDEIKAITEPEWKYSFIAEGVIIE